MTSRFGLGERGIPSPFGLWADVVAYRKTTPVSADLIQTLAGPRLTGMSGMPKHGKSTLATQMAHAIAAQKADLWGLPINAPGEGRVLFAVTDDEAEDELYERLTMLRADTSLPLTISQTPTLIGSQAGSQWNDFGQVVRERADVVFIDNLTGMNGDGQDMNAASTASVLKHHVRSAIPQHVPLVMITHATQPANAAKKIAGSHGWPAMFRRITLVEKQSKLTKVSVSGNRTGSLSLMLERDPDTGLLSPADGVATLTPPKVRSPIGDEQYKHAVNMVGLTKAEAGQYLSEAGLSVNPKAGATMVDRSYIGTALLTFEGPGRPLRLGPCHPNSPPV